MKNTFRYIFCLLLLSFSELLSAGNITIQVVDSLTLKGVPFVALKLEKSRKGALTDNKGFAELYIPANEGDTINMTVSVLGYKTRLVRFSRFASSIMIPISSDGVKLDEVTVKKKKDKYSKKNNPAVQFLEKIRSGSHKTDPRINHDYYLYDRYERISLGLNKFDIQEDTSSKKKNQFSFLKNYIDTCYISGKPILIVAVKEKASTITYRREPKTEKTIIRGVKREGLDDILDQESVQTFLEDVMREIDLYQNDIIILLKK